MATVARAQTPERQQTTRPAITAAQKQQLIDNLQTEITGRARKLRAQYALHARSLHDRLEMRINRIPHNLRKMNLEELINKYAEDLEPAKSRLLPVPQVAATVSTEVKKIPVKDAGRVGNAPSKAVKAKPLKRASVDISVGDDKENAQADLDLPKKRVKINPLGPSGAPTKPSAGLPPSRGGRIVSRKVDPSQVLSPKSHNSRTLPYSPIKPVNVSPMRSLLARPISPVKTLQMSSIALDTSMPPPIAKGKLKPTTSRTTSKQTTTTSAGGSLRGKPLTSTTTIPLPDLPAGSGPAPIGKSSRTRAASNASNASGTSAGTMIVKKEPAAPAAKKKIGVASRIANGLAGAGSKRAATTAAKKAASAANTTTAAPVASGRTLRSRK